MSSTMRWTKRAVTAAALFIAVVGMGSLLTASLASKFGDMTLGMKTGSMRGAINPGDLIVDRAAPVSSVKVGDVITARRPTDHAPYSHRVYAIVTTTSGIAFRTKGDANSAVDPWLVSYPSGTAYEVEHVIRHGGSWLNLVESKPGRDLTAASVFVLVLMLLWPVIVGAESAIRPLEPATAAGAA